ncbi:MAG: hypothetical protein ACJ8R9_33710 [Steroidobacteraceae bacterium]
MITAMRAYVVMFSLLTAGASAVASATTEEATAPPGPTKPNPAGLPHPQGPRFQIDPTADLRDTFPRASQISLGVAVVPDPMVPRYRRLYDLSVEAIELGMLDAGYVLDRYSLPWGEQLQAQLESTARPSTDKDDSAAAEDAQGAEKTDSTTEAATSEKSDAVPSDVPYGLLVFRCDLWRKSECSKNQGPKQRSHIRALYVVTDTATYGLSDHGLRKAARRIKEQIREPSSTTQPQVSLLAFPSCPATNGAPLVVLGPNFSGALDSVGEQSAEIARGPIKGICLVSGGATNPTNQLVHESYPKVHYVPLALDDWTKLAHVAGLAQQLLGLKDSALGVFRDVTILAEASTFGSGVCEKPGTPDGSYSSRVSERRLAAQLCRDARMLYFPASIADLRDEVQQQQDAARRDAHNPLHLTVPDDQLPLQMRAENGSEYPESRQSESTTASKQLALEQLLTTLSALKPPKLVIIVATDVRDRLFLFDKLRERLPRAMFVDLDADNLVAHPTYLHASRGALAIGSAKLLVTGRLERDTGEASRVQSWPDDGDIYGCPTLDPRATRSPSPYVPKRPFSSWSSDSQAILADSVQRLYEPGSAATAPPCFVGAGPEHVRHATVQVVTLEGLKPISTAYPLSVQTWPQPVRLTLELAETLAPLFCIAVAWIWIAALLPSRPRAQVFRHPLWRQAGAVGTVETAAIACACFAVLSLCFTFEYRSADYDNPLFFWLVAAVVISAWRLLACRRLLRQTRAGALRFDSQQAFAPAALAICAALLAAAPWYWEHLIANADSAGFIDQSALINLALDPDAGLAFFLVIAIGSSALLYTSLTLEMGAAIVHRNLSLMKATRRASQLITPSVRSELKSELLGPLSIQVAAVVLIAALTLPDLLGISSGVRLTVFGSFASCVALVALMATTITAAMLTLAALRAGRRIIGLSGHMRNAYLTSRNVQVADPSSEVPGFWAPDALTPGTFPTTPVTAHASHLAATSAALLEPNQTIYWHRLLSAWLYKGSDDSEHRAAVFLLFATEIGVHRWLVAGAVLCALASVGIVYLFPIESGMLLLLNVGLMITAGSVAGYMATAFEGDGLLSNVLCNRPRKVKLSMTLFVFIAAPFLALSGAIAVTRIPGVVDWSGGVIGLLLGLGLHP